jgi:hypothetical protein
MVVQVVVQDYQLVPAQQRSEEPEIRVTEVDNLLIQMPLMEALEAVVLGTEQKTVEVTVVPVLVEREYMKV